MVDVARPHADRDSCCTGHCSSVVSSIEITRSCGVSVERGVQQRVHERGLATARATYDENVFSRQNGGADHFRVRQSANRRREILALAASVSGIVSCGEDAAGLVVVQREHSFRSQADRKHRLPHDWGDEPLEAAAINRQLGLEDRDSND